MGGAARDLSRPAPPVSLPPPLAQNFLRPTPRSFFPRPPVTSPRPPPERDATRSKGGAPAFLLPPACARVFVRRRGEPMREAPRRRPAASAAPPPISRLFCPRNRTAAHNHDHDTSTHARNTLP